MDKMIKFLGIVVLIGMLLFGTIYLMGSTGVVSNINPGVGIGKVIRGITDSLSGIGTSISGMFSNFAR